MPWICKGILLFKMFNADVRYPPTLDTNGLSDVRGYPKNVLWIFIIFFTLIKVWFYNYDF